MLSRFTHFRRKGKCISGRSFESSPSSHHWLQDLSAKEVLGRPRPRLDDLRWVQRHWGSPRCMPGTTDLTILDNVGKKSKIQCIIFKNTLTWKPSNAPPLLLLFLGRLWRSSAVPAGAGPLGGARRGELRPHRLHRGEQTQRVHPHRHLHPLDRGNTYQRLLPTLSGTPDSALTANISSALWFVTSRTSTDKLIQCVSPSVPYTISPLQDVNTCSECAIIIF